MTDFASLVQALDALKHASDIVKALRSADSVYEKAELKLKIAELAEALANTRLSVIEAQSEIQALKDQLSRLSADARSKINEREGVYFVRTDEGETGPICPRCFDVDGVQVRVARLTGPFTVIGKYTCPQCKSNY